MPVTRAIPLPALRRPAISTPSSSGREPSTGQIPMHPPRPPASTWAGLLCPPRSPAHPYPPAIRPQPSLSSLLFLLQTPEPAGLSLRTEESDSGSKSQDLHPQYSPVLKKENPRVPTQKEGNGEPKEVLGWRILEQARPEGGEGGETKSRQQPARSGAWEGRGLQRAQAPTWVALTHSPPQLPPSLLAA